jgi:hypothetical protein
LSRESPGAFPLFDLLARRWRLPAPAAELCFNASASAVAATLADGRVALVDVADAEPPEKRIVVDDAGRRTIAPRRGEPRPAVVLAARGAGPARLAPGRGDNFLIARGDGSLAALAPDGGEALTRRAVGGEVLALHHAAGMTAIVAANGVEIADQRGGQDWDARHVAISPDGAWIAFGGGDGLLLTNSARPFAVAQRRLCPGPVERLVWSGDAAYLAAACGKGGLALLDLAGERFGAIGDFPTPPRSIAFSAAANALVASGAFRIAAWDLARPPFAGERRGALETGRPGLVAVVEVAAHPSRNLVAAAWANGQIAIAALGGRDELILQPAGLAPSSLVWSGDGKTLAIASGEMLSLVSLPDALFK